jgi:hypothetical protein
MCIGLIFSKAPKLYLTNLQNPSCLRKDYSYSTIQKKKTFNDKTSSSFILKTKQEAINTNLYLEHQQQLLFKMYKNNNNLPLNIFLQKNKNKVLQN